MSQSNGLPGILAVGEEPPPIRRGPTSQAYGRAKGKKPFAVRFQTMNAFLDFTMRHLGRAEIAVWALLWRDTKANGLAKTSQVDLARRAGVNERTVRRALAALQKAGLLDVVSRGGLRRGSSAYRVLPMRGQ